MGETLVGSFPQRSEDPEGNRLPEAKRTRLMKPLGFNLLPCLFLAGAVLPTCILGQVKPNATAADVGLYAGPDRLPKLVEGAKKERELNLYTSAPSGDTGGLASAYAPQAGSSV